MKSRNDFRRNEMMLPFATKESVERDRQEWLEYLRWYAAIAVMAEVAANAEGDIPGIVDRSVAVAVGCADALVERMAGR